MNAKQLTQKAVRVSVLVGVLLSAIAGAVYAAPADAPVAVTSTLSADEIAG